MEHKGEQYLNNGHLSNVNLQALLWPHISGLAISPYAPTLDFHMTTHVIAPYIQTCYLPSLFLVNASRLGIAPCLNPALLLLSESTVYVQVSGFPDARVKSLYV